MTWLWSLGCRLVVDYPGTGEDSHATLLTGDSADSTASPTLPEGEAPRALVLGEGADDRIGEGGLATAPDLDGDGSDELLVSVPSLEEVGVFELAELSGEVPYGAATAWIEAPGLGHGALCVGDALAVAAPSESTIWWLPAGPLSGRVDAAQLASGALVGGQVEGDLQQIGAALASGDYDGDGLPDLATGSPTDRAGDGRALLATASDGLGTATLAADALSVSIRGVGGGLGAAVALGELQGAGAISLLACAPGAGSCWVVPGGQEIDDRDVDDVASATLQGDIGASAPRLEDVDGDGATDVLAATASGEVLVWLGPLAPGVHDAGSAQARISGLPAISALARGGGTLLVSVPSQGAGTVFEIGLAPAALLPDEAARVWRGSEAGDDFGHALTSVNTPPGVLAVAAPGAVGLATGSGTVALIALE